MAEKRIELPTEEQEMEEEKQDSDKDEDSEEEESDEEEYFEVEKITSRKKRNGKFLYRVRWKGYPPSNDTWEPVENLEVVLDMVEEFDTKEEQKNKARQEERRLRKLRMEGKKLPGEKSSDESSNSSDDERLLNEDTKFFKMLEKNKHIVFGQPDLYSKVKSRTAILASKKKAEESRREQSSTSNSPSGSERKRRGRGRGRGRGDGSRGRGRGQRLQKASSLDTDNSEDSDASATPVKKGRGRGQGRPRKKLISDSSEAESGDSDDSVPLKKLKKSTPKSGKRIIRDDTDDSSEGSVGRKVQRSSQKSSKKGKISEDISSENESSSSGLESDVELKKPVKMTVAETASTGKTESKASPGSKGGKGDKSETKSISASCVTKSKPKENLTSSSTFTKSDRSRVVIPVLEKFARQSGLLKDTVADKKDTVAEKKDTVAERDTVADKKDSVADKKEISADKKDTVPVAEKKKSVAEKDSVAEKKKSLTEKDTVAEKKKCVVVRDTVTEKKKSLADKKGYVADKETVSNKKERISSIEKSSAASPRNREEKGERKKVLDKTPSSDNESMEVDNSEQNQKQREKGKKKTVSRKRKQDTAAAHAKVVSEGDASAVKVTASVSQDLQSTNIETKRSPVPMDVTQDADSDAEDNVQKVPSDKKVPPLKISVPKFKQSSPKPKPESPKLHAHSPKPHSESGKPEKQKSRGDNVKSGSASRDSIVDRSSVKTVQPSIRPSSKESVHASVSSELSRSPNPAASSGAVGTAAKKDVFFKSSKSDSVSKQAKPEVTDIRYSKPEQPRTPVKSESSEKSSRQEHLDLKVTRPETVDYRKKYNVGSNRDFMSPPSSAGSRESVFSVFSSASSSARDTASAGRDSTPYTSSRDTSSGLFSSYSSTSSVRDTPGLYSSARDTSTSVSGRSGSLSSVSSKDQSQSSSSQFSSSSGSGRDFHFSSGTRGDIHLASGYIHLTSGSSRDSSFSSSSSRDLHYGRGDPKGASPSTPSRHGLNSSMSISGKENADRQHSGKPSSSVPKKGDGMQPLDTILKSSLYPADGDRSKQFKGLDSDFDMVLQRIDLEYLEKLLLPPVTPMELSDEELRQAVINGNCYLVERALACLKPYNLDMPDNKGYTLLMNAVLRGSDDIIVHLLSRGADAQVQVNGHTALMLAVEHAECSTVFMLLEMGAHVNTADNLGETAIFRAVRRGDKQILKLLLDHGANFTVASRAGLSPLQMAKQCRLADMETTLNDHVQRVVRSFEEQVNLTVRGTAKLVSSLFPHYCVPLYESDTINIPFKYQPSLPSGPGMGCLLFIAHARFSTQDVKCRLYGQCAVEKVMLNGVSQPCLTEESNFVLMCHPLIAGWNELVIHTRKDTASKAKLIVCAYRAQLICK